MKGYDTFEIECAQELADGVYMVPGGLAVIASFFGASGPGDHVLVYELTDGRAILIETNDGEVSQ